MSTVPVDDVQASGFSASWGIVVAVVGTLLGVGGLVLAVLR